MDDSPKIKIKINEKKKPKKKTINKKVEEDKESNSSNDGISSDEKINILNKINTDDIDSVIAWKSREIKKMKEEIGDNNSGFYNDSLDKKSIIKNKEGLPMCKINIEKKGWDTAKNEMTKKFIFKLKYNRTINNFFFFSLKGKENFWSWTIIVLSTMTSSITLLNNIETEPFQYFFSVVRVFLAIFSISITLIAAWMKKQQYIERINTIDRYLQKMNKLIEELEVQMILIPGDRMEYKEFKNKYHPQITEYLSTTPAMSPYEWKSTVYQITKYYPELISQDGLSENKLWPWYGYNVNKQTLKISRPKTHFGKSIMSTYNSLTCCGRLQSCCCCTEKHYDIDVKEDDIELGKRSYWNIMDSYKIIENKNKINEIFKKYGINNPFKKMEGSIFCKIKLLDVQQDLALIIADTHKEKEKTLLVPFEILEKIN